MSRGNPTVKPSRSFNAEADADSLRKAMKGLGTDEAAIIAVLTQRSNEQRQHILQAYITKHGRDLMKDLKSELGGHLEDVVVSLMRTPAQADAAALKSAMKGAGTDEEMLVEIMCTRTNQQIHDIKLAYQTMFNDDLEEDLSSETSGYLKRVLISCVQANRSEAPANQSQAVAEAQALFEAGENRFGTDESEFVSTLVSKSPAQIAAICKAYEKFSGHTLVQSIERELSGDLAKGLRAIVEVNTSPAFYFARRLYESMKGAGTNDRVLIHTIVSRSEIDLADIKYAYQKEYGDPIETAVAGDCSGDYKSVLLALLGA